MADQVGSEQKPPERNAWHKPELQQLTVSLDTNVPQKGGSAADGATFDGFSGSGVFD